MKTNELPEQFRPYDFHGLDLSITGDEARTDCIFCGRSNKLSISKKTGKYRCFTCEAQGNHYRFLRELWKLSKEKDVSYTELAFERGIQIQTLRDWGVCKSILTKQWLVPGFNTKGDLTQLYRYAKTKQGMKLLATPNPMSHAIHGLDKYDSKNKVIYLCEGPWDAMRLWEVLGTTKEENGEFKSTTSKTNNLLKGASVLAVPGCSTFKDSWSYVFRGKKVYIVFDNDYPRTNPTTNKELPPAGYKGVQRVANILTKAPKKPKDINLVRWGPEGYTKDLPDSYDVRDALKTVNGEDPQKKLKELINKLEKVPEAWTVSKGITEQKIKPLDCNKWMKLRNSWKKALKWSEGLESGLVCMLACISSTELSGDQLWMKIVGPASCGKSTLCDAIDVSHHVFSRSSIRGFHSGFKSDAEGEEDHSLIVKVDNKTLVTKDGDTLLSSPGLDKILSEARDIYDRKSSASYLNSVHREYNNIRMTWIICGTSSIRALDSSELGARFLDCVIMEGIDFDEEYAVLKRVAAREDQNLSVGGSENSPDKVDEAMLVAQKMTGGYVNYLRDNAQELMKGISAVEKLDEIINLARFVAFMRARPSIRQKETVEREYGARLTSQLTRLAKCSAMVLNKKKVDDTVMRVVKKVAQDTSRGHTQSICSYMYREGSADLKALQIACNQSENEIRRLLTFLTAIEAVEPYEGNKSTKTNRRPKRRHRLTRNMRMLFSSVEG